MKLQSLL